MSESKSTAQHNQNGALFSNACDRVIKMKRFIGESDDPSSLNLFEPEETGSTQNLHRKVLKFFEEFVDKNRTNKGPRMKVFTFSFRV